MSVFQETDEGDSLLLTHKGAPLVRIYKGRSDFEIYHLAADILGSVSTYLRDVFAGRGVFTTPFMGYRAVTVWSSAARAQIAMAQPGSFLRCVQVQGSYRFDLDAARPMMVRWPELDARKAWKARAQTPYPELQLRFKARAALEGTSLAVLTARCAPTIWRPGEGMDCLYRRIYDHMARGRYECLYRHMSHDRLDILTIIRRVIYSDFRCYTTREADVFDSARQLELALVAQRGTYGWRLPD